MRTTGVFIAVILAICISSILSTGDALQCYKCNSNKNPNCGKVSIKDDKEITKEQCTGPVTKCNKVVVHKTGTNGGYIVTRGCHTATSCKRSLNSQIIKCLTCKGDLCNDGEVGTEETPQ